MRYDFRVRFLLVFAAGMDYQVHDMKADIITTTITEMIIVLHKE